MILDNYLKTTRRQTFAYKWSWTLISVHQRLAPNLKSACCFSTKVYPDGIRHIRADKRVNEWKTPGKKTIVRCAVNQRQVVIALTGGELVYFEMDPVRKHVCCVYLSESFLLTAYGSVLISVYFLFILRCLKLRISCSWHQMFSILCLMLLVPWIKMTPLAWGFWVCVYYSRPFRSVYSHLIALYFLRTFLSSPKTWNISLQTSA